MNLSSWLAVTAGAAAGACLRWQFGLLLNAVVPEIPLGTLVSNLIAAFLIGVAIETFSAYATIAPEVRLFVITGFLGGLSTFSTFSAEVVTLLQQREYWWSLAAASAHLVGSLAMTVAGIVATRMLLSLQAS